MFREKHSCRWISVVVTILCCAVLLVSVSGNVWATQVEHIEPIWYEQGDPNLDGAFMPGWEDGPDYADTLEEAALELREELKDRDTRAVVYLRTRDYGKETITQIFNLAVAHTGDPTEGDYISHQFGGYGAELDGYAFGPVYYLKLTYFMDYFTTERQEKELDVAVEELLDQLDLYEATDYRKVKGVYDWLCQNVTYDYAHMNDEDYLLCHSAYAAIIDRTAVCQGYATAMYRLLLELDVDTRYVAGIGNGGPHGWNIVKLGTKYYNLDATWDATYSQAGCEYQYFLKNDADFEDHWRDDDEYDFVNTEDYPVAKTSFEQAQFTVTFQDADGRVLSQETYGFGQKITPPQDPERAPENGISYTFLSWDQEVGVCEGDQTFTAQYQQTYEEYHVYFKDDNGAELSHKIYHYGDAIVAPEAPIKAADNTYIYTFSGWDADVGTCTGDQTFTAVYAKNYIDYVVTFQYADGTLIMQDTYHYGDAVSAPKQVNPPAGQEDLVYRGWDSPVTNCFGDKVYTAVFASVSVNGDLDGDDMVTNSDVVYLLWHTLFPESYPVGQNADYSGDGQVTNDDVVYLLWHTLFPDSYPLT